MSPARRFRSAELFRGGSQRSGASRSRAPCTSASRRAASTSVAVLCRRTSIPVAFRAGYEPLRNIRDGVRFDKRWTWMPMAVTRGIARSVRSRAAPRRGLKSDGRRRRSQFAAARRHDERFVAGDWRLKGQARTMQLPWP
jgi:hypothetical protein